MPDGIEFSRVHNLSLPKLLSCLSPSLISVLSRCAIQKHSWNLFSRRMQQEKKDILRTPHEEMRLAKLTFFIVALQEMFGQNQVEVLLSKALNTFFPNLICKIV
jgi:hypothetical protein